MSVADDLTVLGLSVEASAVEVKRTYRELAFQRHPDRGGDPDAFQNLKEAFARLRRRKCAPCRGKGMVVRQRGLYSSQARCQSCEGSGLFYGL